MRRKNKNPNNCDENCMLCKNRFNCKKRVLLGYERLAFGSTADSFKLLICENPQNNFSEAMDLFNVSEIKKPKDGAMEIKFFDRIKALEHLENINEGDENATSFYDVLNDCAKGLRRSENNEV